MGRRLGWYGRWVSAVIGEGDSSRAIPSARRVSRLRVWRYTGVGKTSDRVLEPLSSI